MIAIDRNTQPAINVAVIDGKEVFAVDLRELHGKLSIKTDYNVWSNRRRVDCPLIEGQNCVTILPWTSAGKTGRPPKTTLITIRSAHILAVRATSMRGEIIQEYLEGHMATPIGHRETLPGLPPEGNGATNSDSPWPTVTLGEMNGEPALVLDARELHQKLGPKSHYRDWFARRVKDCQLIEHKDFRLKKSESPGVGYETGFRPFVGETQSASTGRPEKSHIVTMAAANQMAMLERNAIGFALRAYLARCEERLGLIAPEAAAEESLRLAADIAGVPHLEGTPNVPIGHAPHDHATTDAGARQRAPNDVPHDPDMLLDLLKSVAALNDTSAALAEKVAAYVKESLTQAVAPPPTSTQITSRTAPRLIEAPMAPSPPVAPQGPTSVRQARDIEQPKTADATDDERPPPATPGGDADAKPSHAAPSEGAETTAEPVAKPKRVPPSNGGSRPLIRAPSSHVWFARRIARKKREKAEEIERRRAKEPDLRNTRGYKAAIKALKKLNEED